MEPPAKPDESECCGSGCKPCVFDVYEEQLTKWKSKQTITQSRALNQTKYLPYLIKSLKMTGTLLTLQFQCVSLVKNETRIYIENAQPETEYRVLDEFLNIKSGEYLIMKGVHDSGTISRSFTPILNEENFRKGMFTITVSLLAEGRMSKFLATLKVNDIVFWRGPYEGFAYQPNSFKAVLLIGGGTGVIPLYNVSKSIVENDEDDTLVSVMASFKSADCIVLREEFARLRDFWNFRTVFYISNQTEVDFKMRYNEVVSFGRITEVAIEEELRKHNAGFVIVCGPEGFNHFVKESLKNCNVDDGNIFIFWYGRVF